MTEPVEILDGRRGTILRAGGTASAVSNVAVAVELPDHDRSRGPAVRLAELVWTEDDGWVSRIQARHRLSSIDFSPGGQHVVFASDTEYGAAHHVTTLHVDLGWEEHEPQGR